VDNTTYWKRVLSRNNTRRDEPQSSATSIKNRLITFGGLRGEKSPAEKLLMWKVKYGKKKREGKKLRGFERPGKKKGNLNKI